MKIQYLSSVEPCQQNGWNFTCLEFSSSEQCCCFYFCSDTNVLLFVASLKQVAHGGALTVCGSFKQFFEKSLQLLASQFLQKKAKGSVMLIMLFLHKIIAFNFGFLGFDSHWSWCMYQKHWFRDNWCQNQWEVSIAQLL